jgi:hypothetical protein
MKKTIAIATILAALAGPALAQSDPHHPDQAPAQGTMGQGMMQGQGMMGCPMGMMGPGGPHTEGRLAYLKTELKITSAQEEAWKAYSAAVQSIDQKRMAAMGMMGGMTGMKGQGMMNGQGTSGQGMMNGPGMMGGGMMQQGSTLPAPDALKKRVEFMEEHVKILKELQTATKKLYRELDDTQKKTADELLSMPCCKGAM